MQFFSDDKASTVPTVDRAVVLDARKAALGAIIAASKPAPIDTSIPAFLARAAATPTTAPTMPGSELLGATPPVPPPPPSKPVKMGAGGNGHEAAPPIRPVVSQDSAFTQSALPSFAMIYQHGVIAAPEGQAGLILLRHKAGNWRVQLLGIADVPRDEFSVPSDGTLRGALETLQKDYNGKLRGAWLLVSPC